MEHPNNYNVTFNDLIKDNVISGRKITDGISKLTALATYFGSQQSVQTFHERYR